MVRTTLLTAAVAGIIGSIGCSHDAAPASGPTAAAPSSTTAGAVAAPEKHACKGQNSCKGNGGCKTDKNACKGQNSCKRTGGCKTA